MIELTRYRPDPNSPNYIIPDGQPTASEVFNQLYAYLDAVGYLPDEYFLLAMDWQNDRAVPKDVWFAISADYGGSEGIYLDIDFVWYEDGERHCSNFATGKTLKEDFESLCRMNLVAAYVISAFTCGGGSRSICTAEPGPSETLITGLAGEERALLIEALINQREANRQQGLPTSGEEKLIRRFAGSVTRYVRTIGTKDSLDERDLAILSITESDMETFNTLLPKANQYHELLPVAAGHTGRVGLQMTIALLGTLRGVQCQVYKAACRAAVETGETPRVLLLLQKAAEVIGKPDDTVVGDAMSHTLKSKNESYLGSEMIDAIIEQASEAEIKATDGTIVLACFNKHNYTHHRTAQRLIQRGIDLTPYAHRLYWYAARENSDYLFSQFKDIRLDIDTFNGWCLRAALLEKDDYSMARLFLKNGANPETALAVLRSEKKEKDAAALEALVAEVFPQTPEAPAAEESEEPISQTTEE